MKKFIMYSTIEKDNGKSITIVNNGYSDFKQAVYFANIMLKDCREVYNDNKAHASFVAPYDLDFEDGTKAVQKWVHIEPITIF